jgi:hypothetical protein
MEDREKRSRRRTKNDEKEKRRDGLPQGRKGTDRLKLGSSTRSSSLLAREAMAVRRSYQSKRSLIIQQRFRGPYPAKLLQQKDGGDKLQAFAPGFGL